MQIEKKMQYERLTHTEYLELAIRTMAPTFYVDNHQNIMGFLSEEAKSRLLQLHCAIGIVTEVDELHTAICKYQNAGDVVNIGEELADILWYSANLEVILGVKLPEEYGLSIGDVPLSVLKDEISHSASEILDIFKKALFYNKPIQAREGLIDHLNCINLFVTRMVEAVGLDVSVLRAKNINKLMVRFPDKFSEVNAQLRNLKAEYEALK